MSEKYQPKKIEYKWQQYWEKNKVFAAEDFSKKPKYYCLVEFPYPSAEGLHVGHPRSYTAMDILARKKRMQGFNVLYPMGFDAFGLPAENYAIKKGVHPRITTEKNIANYRRQLKMLGYSFDWDREISTIDPEYYKWTQWIFLQLYKKGLAYKKEMPINWCPSCKIGLANEEVVAGNCERCGTQVSKKTLKQWLLKITKYADRLLQDLGDVDYQEKIKTQQVNWIGKSEGAMVDFRIKDQESRIKVFTTRPDTLFGATYMVLAPEHELIQKLKPRIKNFKEVEKYIKQAAKKSDLERTELAKEKTGVELKGIKAINPVNKKEIPVWVADYVLISYGTGAIMAVPAHDQRDFDFAKKYGLEIIQVIKPVKNKRNCVIIHGSPESREKDEAVEGATNERHWQSWLKDKLVKMGWQVDNPLMSTPWKPDYKTWKEKIEKLNINENTTLIGHSAGGAFVMRWLEDSKKKIDKLILIAPEKKCAKENERLHDLCSFEINSEVKNLVNDIKILYSTGDKPYRQGNAQFYHEKIGGDLIKFTDKGHFTFSGMQTKEFPELLDMVVDHTKADGDVESGVMINSGKFDDMEVKKSIKEITKWLEKEKIGKKDINYKLRDWIFSRQHYWGEPIPVVYCEQCAENNKKVLILHGWEDSSKSGFVPALRENLEAKNYQTFAFDAPNTDAPNFDEWYKFTKDRIMKNSLEDFTLVGHSMGGLLALKLAEKHRLKKLVLVAPVGSQPSKEYFEQFKDDLTEYELDIFRKYQDRDLEIDKIKKNVDEMVFVFGKKDPWVTEEIRNSYQDKFKDIASFHLLEDQPHMCDSEGVKRVEFIEELFDEAAATAGLVPVPEKDLPVELPEVKKYEPTETGESPLAAIKDWVNTKCPECGGKAQRETDTMPNWAGSSWYFLRYTDSQNDKVLADKKKLDYWTPVDWYNGGMEHTTLHLLYSRFWHKFLYDLGVVPIKEPYRKRTSHGMILGEDNQKMSKSRGNVVNPDDVVLEYGADTMRMYEMFIGPFSEAAPWSTKGIMGVRRFLDKVWTVSDKKFVDKDHDKNLTKLTHQTIKKVSEDIDDMRYNTAVSALMILVNAMQEPEEIYLENYKTFLMLLSPLAPHLTEELWEKLGNKSSIIQESWPEYDKKLIIEEEFELVIQINGKVRDKIKVPAGITQKQAEEKAKQSPKIQKYLEGKEVVKVVFVPKRLINLVVK